MEVEGEEGEVHLPAVYYVLGGAGGEGGGREGEVHLQAVGPGRDRAGRVRGQAGAEQTNKPTGAASF